MSEITEQPLISCFLLKVASRCNINCDYCYMYNHLDQGYKLQPKLMSPDILSLSATRILDYVLETKQKRIAIVYHGGEPLLLGTNKLVEHINLLKSILPNDIYVEFSLQTNGLLLKEVDIQAFELCGLQVSLSLDGPQTVNDRHRLDHNGNSSFNEVNKALEQLQKYPHVFSGVIAVIDPLSNPEEILNFFSLHHIPQLDFLLPDANYLTPPPIKDKIPHAYSSWLKKCFDVWFDQYPNIKIRTFDNILAALFGVPSDTDGFGFGDVSLITIETDGSYHDLDVLKITGNGTSLNAGNVVLTPIKEAIQANQLTLHRKLLQKEGLCSICQKCEIVDICGGGAVAHRFGENGYINPSIYCDELKELIGHINMRVNLELSQEFIETPLNPLNLQTVENYEIDIAPSLAMNYVLSSFQDNQVIKFKNIITYLNKLDIITLLHEDELRKLSIQPSVIVWTAFMEKIRDGVKMTSIDGKIIEQDDSYFMEIISIMNNLFEWPRVQSPSNLLRIPFGKDIYFETQEIIEKGKMIIDDAISLIYSWKPSIIDEMRLISPDIQFIRDPKAHIDQIVSFSDNSVPGALYVQLVRSKEYISPCDLADSIIHEHRHQKLYLLQRLSPIINQDFPLVKSPWREELRPPTGLFHALYVFVELLDFWTILMKNNKYSERAMIECQKIKEKLNEGFLTIENCDLTETGKLILSIIKKRYENKIS